MADWNIGSLVLTDNPGHLLGPGSVLLSEHAWQSEHTNTQEKKKRGDSDKWIGSKKEIWSWKEENENVNHIAHE